MSPQNQTHPAGGTSRRRSALWLVVLVSMTLAPAGSAQTPATKGPWFGVPLPPVFEPHVAPAIIGDRGPVPAIVPPGEGEYLELTGAAIRADLETIVRFSRESRERREIGSGQAYRPRRTLVFVASAGHHSPGLNGPRHVVAMNPVIAENAVLALNIEHVAQSNLSPARSLFVDGYREFIADSGEAPIVAGVSNEAPFLDDLFTQGVERYGTNFVSGPSTMASGEGGGYRSLGVAIVTIMQAPPLYHTSGEVVDVISTPGLERIARFLAFFIKQVDQAPRSLINP